MAAARMAETVPSEVPYQCGNRVLSFFQEGRDVYFIVIGVSGSGTPLQGAFENDRFAVDPEPVFAVRCDTGDGLSGNILHVGGGAVHIPAVGITLVRLVADPDAFPRGFGP